MRPVGRPQIQVGSCFVTTVTSAITPTAWTLHCRMFPKTAGSANGERAMASLEHCYLDSLRLNRLHLIVKFLISCWLKIKSCLCLESQAHVVNDVWLENTHLIQL